jgi:hypothetical protein
VGKHGESFWALYTNPKWNNQIGRAVFRGPDSAWPDPSAKGIAYRCRFESDGVLVAPSVTFEVNFGRAAERNHTITLRSLPDQITPAEPLSFYITDDTPWVAAVVLPETIKARATFDTEPVTIRVHHPGDRPITLRGFGVQP